MSEMDEPKITINGVQLSVGQAMTVRCAIESFAAALADGLGDDEHGRGMTTAYMQRIDEVRGLMFAPAPALNVEPASPPTVPDSPPPLQL